MIEKTLIEVLAFPTFVLGFNLTGRYDPDETIKGSSKIVASHGLLNSDNSEDGSSYGKIGFLDSKPSLKTLMQECVDTYTSKLDQEDLGLWDSWINIGSKGSQIIRHRHEGSVISGAFYPKIDGDPELSPPLILHSPLSAYHSNTKYTQVNAINSYQEILPSWEGMLWLFPSWCEHSTTASQADKRYVISFNTYPKKYDALANRD